MKHLPFLFACALALAACDDGGSSEAASDAAPPADDAAVAADAAPPLATPTEIADQVDMTRYAANLEFVARPRPPQSAHWQAVQDRCAETFAAAGFTVERHQYRTGVNVVGVLPGVEKPDELVVLSAHYDHLPNCIGADDNASGTAGVLEAARVLGGRSYARTLVVACWDEEEWGKIGSIEWAARAKRQGHTVHASIVLETMGFYTERPGAQRMPNGFEFVFPELGAFVADRDARGDFIVAIADDLNTDVMDDFKAHAATIGLDVGVATLNSAFRNDPSLGDLRRSDHDAFWLQDWPGIMITDSANFRNPHYHCTWGEDDIADVDMDFATKNTQAATYAIAKQAEPMAGTPGAVDTTSDPAPPTDPCDLIAQDCGAGKKCVGLLNGGTEIKCVDARAEDVADGAQCTRPNGVAGEDDCAKGLVCTFYGEPPSDPQTRTCGKLCRANADCGAGGGCVQLYTDRRVGVCVEVCDPLDADACPGGTCVLYRGATAAEQATTCAPAAPGPTPAGGDCAMAPCAEGLSCLPALSDLTARCIEWCAGDGDCPADADCLHTATPELGRCVPRAPGG